MLFECHNSATTYTLVTRGKASALDNDYVLGVLRPHVGHLVYFTNDVRDNIETIKLI